MRPLTHTQYKDRDGADLATCPAGDHSYVDDEDTGLAVCTRCGHSDIEPELW